MPHMSPSLLVRKALNKAFLRKWTQSRQSDTVERLARESGLAPGFKDEISFWALELSGHGYHPEVLDRLTPQGMAADFPAIVDELISTLPGVPRTADVGSGPLSELAYGDYQKRMVLTAIDPLADVYATLLRSEGRATGYKRLAMPAENLVRACGIGAFDLIWSRNAIDHSSDPALAFRAMADSLAPGGFIVLSNFAREGTAENWHGLHQHDLFIDDRNRLMLQSMKDGQLLSPRCISDLAGLSVIRSTGPSQQVKQMFQVVWQRIPAAASLP